ncbi:hypothetical protein B0H16DRAFT_1750081 [Mycena metata]|uniref:Uncharacterized protein n=1 Tax=Mycena metata TaxID=1033252 RepID=A0AAD7DTF3_9AGAR|nr:hypothetical protein B0H16DRAFT_1750081 [Mycena metata]
MSPSMTPASQLDIRLALPMPAPLDYSHHLSVNPHSPRPVPHPYPPYPLSPFSSPSRPRIPIHIESTWHQLPLRTTVAERAALLDSRVLFPISLTLVPAFPYTRAHADTAPSCTHAGM